jgi:hypothetical protein
MVGGEWLVFDGTPARADLQRVNRVYADLAARLAAGFRTAGTTRPA